MLQAPMILCCGSIAAAGTTVWAQGCTIADTGTGVYTVTPDQPVDAAECCCLATLRTASGIVRVTQTSDAAKTIETFAVDGTTATDKAVDFLFLKKMGG